MRGDPFNWSFPLGRLFGITIRVHFMFPLLALALVARVAFMKETPGKEPLPPNLWVDAWIWVGLLFLAVLLHELGHFLGARTVEGDAHEIMMWPLGGLAPLEVPHTPRANFIAAFAGPAVNLLICLGVTLILAAYGFLPLPVLNPFPDPMALSPQLYSWSEQTIYATRPNYRHGDQKFTGYVRSIDGKEEMVSPNSDAPDKIEVPLKASQVADPVIVKEGDKERKVYYRKELTQKNEKIEVKAEPALLSPVQVLLARIFAVNWFLFLMNMLPAFPLDGGRLLHCLWWWRSGDARQALLSAVFGGILVAIVVALFGIIVNEVLPLLLAMLIYMVCQKQWWMVETGEEQPMFGYDFSQGYTSLERDQPPAAPRRPRPNFISRWLQRRAAKKLQRETEQREAEEQRMDELLEKVQKSGLQALTDEERRFLTRVSARYRNNRS